MDRPFTITIREIREKDITINAITVDEAIDAVEYLYSEGNFVLTNDDFEDVEFMCLEEDLEN
jgi:hypothetical protein